MSFHCYSFFQYYKYCEQRIHIILTSHKATYYMLKYKFGVTALGFGQHNFGQLSYSLCYHANQFEQNKYFRLTTKAINCVGQIFSWSEHKKSIMMSFHYPDFGSASDWLCHEGNLPALPRSGWWQVISTEFLPSFRRHHFMGKPVVSL